VHAPLLRLLYGVLAVSWGLRLFYFVSPLPSSRNSLDSRPSMKKEHCSSTQVQFTVNLTDLKRSSRRLLTRLSDESEASGEFVIFNAPVDGLQLVANSTSEGLTAMVSNVGVARIPHHVFRGIVRTFSSYHTRKLTFAFSAGQLTVDDTVSRHPQNLGRLATLAKFGSNAFELRGRPRGSIISSVKRGLAQIG
jgi:hypothetical protein